MIAHNYPPGTTVVYRNRIHLITAVNEAAKTVTVDYPSLDFEPKTVPETAVRLHAFANSPTSQHYAETMREVHERRKRYSKPRPYRVSSEHVPPCPTCRAESGQRCRTARGDTVSYVHAARRTKNS